VQPADTGAAPGGFLDGVELDGIRVRHGRLSILSLARIITAEER
jgi:hypothetical protein